MGAAKITLFVDVVSPFAYEAFHILQNDAIFRDVQKTYVPIFLGGLMKMTGNTPPMNVKNKDVWINKERVRWARAFGVPMAAESPPDFPPPTLQVMRAACGLADDQAALRAVLARLYHDLFVRHAPVARPDVFAPVFREVLGPAEAERVLAEAATTGKARLAKNTDDAFAAGAFGLPWMACTNAAGETEGFWGVDHLGHVARFLDLPRPVANGNGNGDGDGNAEGGWRSVL